MWKDVFLYKTAGLLNIRFLKNHFSYSECYNTFAHYFYPYFIMEEKSSSHCVRFFLQRLTNYTTLATLHYFHFEKFQHLQQICCIKW